MRTDSNGTTYGWRKVDLGGSGRSTDPTPVWWLCADGPMVSMESEATEKCERLR